MGPAGVTSNVCMSNVMIDGLIGEARYINFMRRLARGLADKGCYN